MCDFLKVEQVSLVTLLMFQLKSFCRIIKSNVSRYSFILYTLMKRLKIQFGCCIEVEIINVSFERKVAIFYKICKGVL